MNMYHKQLLVMLIAASKLRFERTNGLTTQNTCRQYYSARDAFRVS